MRKRNALLIVCLVTLLASTAQAQNASDANNAALNGNYAFTFSGFTGSGGNSAVFAAVGRFTADGAGNVTNGELDTNGVGAGAVLTTQPFTGTYTIGADNRGTMTLNIAGSAAKLTFAMTANGNAQFIEFDAAGGTGTIGSGTMERSDTTTFSTAGITGDYAFGLSGFDASNNRLAFAGRFTADGAGNFTNEAGDLNASGTVGSTAFAASSYTVSEPTSGRGTMSLSFSFDGASFTLNFVFYIVNSGKLFAMETDALAGPLPLLNGTVIRQQTPSGGFSNASLNGGMVLSLTGRASCGSGTAPDVIVGLLTGDGNGGFSLSFDENCGGTPTSASLAGAYTITPNGRVGMQLGGNYVAAYMVSTNQAFFIVPDSSALFGFGEPQSGGALSNTAVTGNYSVSATTPAALGVTIFSGEFTADGLSPTGTITGSEDIGAPTGQTWGASASSTYSITSVPTNGRGTMSGNIAGNGVLYVISPSRFVAISLTDANPAVLLFQQ